MPSPTPRQTNELRCELFACILAGARSTIGERSDRQLGRLFGLTEESSSPTLSRARRGLVTSETMLAWVRAFNAHPEVVKAGRELHLELAFSSAPTQLCWCVLDRRTGSYLRWATEAVS